MTSNVVRNLADNIMGSNLPENTIHCSAKPKEPMVDEDSQEHPSSESTLRPWSDGDSGDVDIWLGGDTLHTIGGNQSSRLQTSSQPLPRSSSVDSNTFWYVAAMMLPLVSFGRRGWRCSPSLFLGTVELFYEKLAGFCRTTRSRFQSISREEAARDVFAGAMDIILITYAIGFFLLTMYHASVFGHL